MKTIQLAVQYHISAKGDTAWKGNQQLSAQEMEDGVILCLSVNVCVCFLMKKCSQFVSTKG